MSQTINLFGMKIDAVEMADVLTELQRWIADADGGCRYVVTPNTDHAVMYQHNERLRDAYADAGLVLADGFPVVLAAKLLGRSLPGRVCGSDLVPALFNAASEDRPLRTFLLGAAPGVAERARDNVRERWPAVEIVGTYSPRLVSRRTTRKTRRYCRWLPMPDRTSWWWASERRSRSYGFTASTSGLRHRWRFALARRSTS